MMGVTASGGRHGGACWLVPLVSVRVRERDQNAARALSGPMGPGLGSGSGGGLVEAEGGYLEARAARQVVRDEDGTVRYSGTAVQMIW